MRLGLLSTAKINAEILAGAAESDRVEVVAVASRDRARAEAYAQEHGLARAHGSYEALLADEGVDAVYVSLPNLLHHEWTLAALDAGKHVLCEKPYSRRPADVEEAFARAEQQGLVLMEAFMYRHHPADGAGEGARRRGSPGPSPAGSSCLQLRPEPPRRHPCPTGARRWRADGRRLLLRLAAPACSRASPSGSTASRSSARPVSTCPFTGRCAFPETSSPSSTARSCSRASSGSRSSGTKGRSSWKPPGARTGAATCSSPRAASRPRSRPRKPTRTGSSSRTSPTPQPVSRRALLGREDALGQARAIEALYRAAESGASVSL